MTSEQDPALREADLAEIENCAVWCRESGITVHDQKERRAQLRRLILAALPQDDGWRDVETDPPPRGSHAFFVYGKWSAGFPDWWGIGACNHAGMVYGAWDEDAIPTHWKPVTRPLPDPPQPKGPQP